MAGRVKWTEAALDDLDNIAAYIARDSRFYASVIVREIRDAARSISFMPLRGRMVPELGDERVREILVRQYRLVYRLAEDGIFLVGIIHGARDLGTVFRRGGRD
jgi:toxin ParE1/3/4